MSEQITTEQVRAIVKGEMESMSATLCDKMDRTVEPLVDSVRGIRLTVYGADGRNGLNGDVRSMKDLQARRDKWTGVIGGAAATAFVGAVVNFIRGTP